MAYIMNRSGIGRQLMRGYSSAFSPAISTTLILSRNPVVTADLPEFESSYYRYQNGLWKRLMWTFPKWFYYREGTLSEQRYREINKNPVYNNPNIEFPRGRPEIRHQRDRRFKQEIELPKTYKDAKDVEDGTELTDADNLSRKIVPNSRITEADKQKDTTSLERKLSRTLYLVIQEGGKWRLPSFKESDKELKPLHVLAQEGLHKIGGDEINYFNVSKIPCHVYNRENTKEYFIKSHILAGQFKPQDSRVKFLWLAKEELPSHLDKAYFANIEHLLSDI